MYRAGKDDDEPKNTLEARPASRTKTQGEDGVRGAVHRECDDVGDFPSVRARERPGAGRGLVAAENPPRKRHKGKPAIDGFPTPHQPHRQEETSQRGGDRKTEQLQINPDPASVVRSCLQERGRPDCRASQSALIDREPGHAHEHRVGAFMQERGRQQQIARHVPGARQRLGEVGIAIEKGAVQIDRTRHIEVVEQDCDRRVDARLLPAQPVPYDAIKIRPARRPDVGKLDVDPTGGRRVILLDWDCGLCVQRVGADSLDADERKRFSWLGCWCRGPR